MSLGYDKWLSVYQRYMHDAWKKYISMYIPHSTTCKAKGKKLMLFKKKKKLLKIDTCNGNLHKNSSFTLLLPLPEET